MTLQQAYEKRRQEVLALQREVKQLKKKLDQVDAGLYTPDEKIGYLKKINHLTHELNAATKDRDRYKELWDEQRKRNLYYDFDKMDLEEENQKLKAENEELRKKIALLEENGSEETAAKLKALTDEVARLNAILDNDGTNSGTPTSKTPLGKNKIIPNSRGKSELSKGGQPGHKKHTLDSLSEQEVTETVVHPLEVCPECGGKLEKISCREKDEIDYEVRVIKRRHKYLEYRCSKCGKIVHAPIPNHLKERCQYGSTAKAMVLALLDIGFVSVNRTKKLMKGFFSGAIDPCEAFIIGMQKKAAKKLQAFAADVKKKLLQELILYWDDTVVFINKVRACMRFYGTEKFALFTAHAGKGRDGIDEDELLILLGKNTYVMHDHASINYNADFIFINIECNQHLQRDLEKLAQNSGHKWPALLKELISSTIHARKEKIKAGEASFTDDEVAQFNRKLDEYLEKGNAEYKSDHSRYYEEDERRLLNRLQKYRENYFLWVTDFRLPTTNNLSERSLRFTKVHEKVSGQFESVEYAQYFALIRTYLETCARHGVNEFEALTRLTQDNPFTLSEVISYSGS